MIVIRHPNPGSAEFLSRSVNTIVNAGDGSHEHPTQGLLDSYSIREKFGSVKGKKVLLVGDILHSRVALSNFFCLKKLGAEVRVCGPSTLMPKYLESLDVKHFTDIKKALNWCDIVNVLRIQFERQNVNYFPSLREYSKIYGINKELLDSIDKDILVIPLDL